MVVVSLIINEFIFIYHLSVVQPYFSAQMLFASWLTGNLGQRTAVPEFARAVDREY